jgi:hypothetical protein
MIIRYMSRAAATAAVLFAAPNPHARDEARQHLNGWILICFGVLASSAL